MSCGAGGAWGGAHLEAWHAAHPVEVAQPPCSPPGLRQVTYSCRDQSRSEWVEAARCAGSRPPAAWSETCAPVNNNIIGNIQLLVQKKVTSGFGVPP